MSAGRFPAGTLFAMRTRYILPSVILTIAPLWIAQAQVRSKGPVVAVVDHVEITEDELKLEAQTIQFKKQEYELKVRAIENLVSRKILEERIE